MTFALITLGLFAHTGGVILGLATGSAVNQSENDEKKSAQAGIGMLATILAHVIGLTLIYLGGVL